MKIRLRAILSIVIKSRYRSYFTFVQAHHYLTKTNLSKLRLLIETEDPRETEKYEDSFSNLIGEGDCVAFASARMGFFSLLKFLNINEEDEVVLLGSTCSVMSDAVLRTGAIPIYSDIDPISLGSSQSTIMSAISARTKIVVMQHSFGIPCDAQSILEITRPLDIILIEDCALTLGSKYKGQIVGNIGDFAIFSTDHFKPINTLLGGIVYSKDSNAMHALKKECLKLPTLSYKHQRGIYRQILKEKKWMRRGWASAYELSNLLDRIWHHIIKQSNPSVFFGEESARNSHFQYAYPAQMPSFLAKLGLLEIENWDSTSKRRRDALSKFLLEIRSLNLIDRLPQAYFDSDREIIPRRIVWSQTSGPEIRRFLDSHVDVDATWFLDPIIATTHDLGEFNYKWGNCPLSEISGQGMVNLPCEYIFDAHFEKLKQFLMKQDTLELQ